MVIFLTLVVLTLPTWDAREENEGRQLIFLFFFFSLLSTHDFPLVEDGSDRNRWRSASHILYTM